MIRNPLPQPALEVLLQDAAARDRVTSRRTRLLALLWQERYLTREQLVARLELELGQGCFGDSAWKDNFFRDMRVVRQAFKAAGYVLGYRRSRQLPGYYLDGEPMVSSQLAAILDGSVAEVDRAQIAIWSKLTHTDRVRLGCSISNTAHQVVAYRIQQKKPQISLAEANRQALRTSDEEKGNAS